MERKAIVAEALAGCSVKTLQARGIEWRTCSDEALLALRKRRTLKWLFAFTGYGPPVVGMLRARGLDWHTAREEEIRAAITGHQQAVAARHEARTKVVPFEGRMITKSELARLSGVPVETLSSRRSALGSWAAVVAETQARPGRWRKLRSCGGRPPLVETIDGETRTRREWLAFVRLTKQGLHNAAHKHGRSAAEELTERVKARRSDAAHTPASVASDPTPRMVRGDRSVSACAASGRGAANDTKEVAA